MASSRYNNNGRNGNGGNSNGNGKSETMFCAVCHAAGRPGYDTHFVRADKFDRSSAITCPYLLSIECRNCGKTGHTASYCTTASRASSTAVAAPAPASLARVRLPPISSSSSSQYSSSKHQPQPPRIVFPALEKEQKEREFPQLPTNPNNRKTQSTTTLPPLPLPLSFSRFRNDEPLLKRGPPDAASAAEASPVHSPAATAAAPSNKIVYNKRGNAFADLASSDDELSHHSPAASPAAVGRYRPTKPLSWPSAPSPLLPPLEFKPRKTASSASASAVPKKDKKKLWGDSDSEDDEEFLKRGLE